MVFRHDYSTPRHTSKLIHISELHLTITHVYNKINSQNAMDTDENAEEMFTYRDGRSLRHVREGGGSQHANKNLCFVRTGLGSRGLRLG